MAIVHRDDHFLIHLATGELWLLFRDNGVNFKQVKECSVTKRLNVV
jgi:hypothetical protein